MTDHLCWRDGDLYTCAACEWRAVQTTRGLVVTQHGAPDADHHAGIAVSAQQRRARIERIVTRLRHAHACDWRMFSVDPDESLKRLERWIHCAVTEFEA